jgi:hypothetical protein
MHTNFSHNTKIIQNFVELVNIWKQDATHFQKYKNKLDFNVVPS